MSNNTCAFIAVTLLFWLFIPALVAMEYNGAVKVGGLPMPGAAVTATQNDRKVVTTTDENGSFSFPDLVEGEWTIEVQMLGFSPLRRTVTVGPAPSAVSWDLTFLSKERLVSGTRPTVVKPRGTQMEPPNRNPQRAAVPAARPRDFQRVDVNRSTDPQMFGSEGALRAEESEDLAQSAANSFVVQGSLSSATGLPQQNDWGFGPPGLGGPGAMGIGGPGGNGFGDGAQANLSMDPRRAEGNPVRAEMGGPGGAGPGGPGGGGFGGPGGRGPGGMGRPGGFPGGRGPGTGDGRGPGRPQWQGARDSMVFGNGRRNRRLQYNGMAMFSLNDSVWDARTYSVTGASVDKPDYWNTRGSVIFGGPLRIPKLLSADRQIMFMLNYQFGRSRTGTVSDPVNMPTALERAGDFSQTHVGGSPVVIYDPTTNAPFANNLIPASRLNATSLSLLQYFPQPNLPYSARNYQTSWTGSSDSHNLNTRIMNVRLGTKDRLNGSLGYQNSGSSTPNLFEFIDTGAGQGINANIGWSRNLTTRLTNNVQLGFSRMRQQTTPFFAGVENVAAELGIEGTSGNPMNWGPPTLRFTNYANLIDGNFSLNRNQTTSIGDSLLWVRGQHNWTFGANYRRFQFNQLADTNGRGTWTFNGLATSLTSDGTTQNATGYDLADFLLGAPTTSAIRYGNPDKYFRNSGYDLFVNDDWRIHSRFTLNVGVRWDYASPVTELYDRLVNLSMDPAFTSVTAVVPGMTDPRLGRLPRGLIIPDRNNFSPRLGFAWRPATSRSMVVRGGYGIYYNTSVYNNIASNMAQQPPFAQVLNASSEPGYPLSVDDGFLLATNTPSTSTYAIDPYYRIGYAQTWTVSVQHDLPMGMFGTIGYLGTKGTRLDQQFLPNTVAPGSPQSLLPQGFLYQTSNGNSIYHAAQFQLNRRFRSGLGWNASYQWSKSIDNAGTGGRGQGGTPIAQNWLDYSAERGLSSFDARHNLSIQGQYSTGMGRAGGTLANGWKGAFLKDWTISSMITLRSGNPFTATVGGNRSQVSGTAVNNTVRANSTGLSVDAPGMLFNTAAFTEPLSGQWGNAGRNTIPGPTAFFLNGGVGRVFRLGERRSIDIQMQSQNVLNRVVITNWGTVIGANNYGLAASAAAMRSLTLNVRFRF